MKLWLLDADVTIKFLELGVFDNLAKQHTIHVASTIVSEVKYYRKNKQKIEVDFRKEYIDSGKVVEITSTVQDMEEVLRRLPALKRGAIHAGEIESLAVFVHNESLTLCTFDAAAIRVVPFLDASDRVISAERLLQTSGLTLSPGHKLDPRLSEEYFQSNLSIGQKEHIYSAGT